MSLICSTDNLNIITPNYVFNSSELNCGNNNFLLKQNPLIVKFEKRDFSQPVFRLYLRTGTFEDEPPFSYIEGEFYQTVSYGTVQNFFEITGTYNENKTFELNWESTGFLIRRNGIEYVFLITSNLGAFLFDLEIYLIENKTSTNGQISSTITSKIQHNPEIFIVSQYLIDWSDIGDTLFEVKDLNKRKFDKPCPKIVSVLKGKGCTALDKINYIYQKQNITIEGIDFRDNLVKYSMLKYLLCKILYSRWNIYYLLGKYNNKFLNDLKRSNFNNFLDFFINPESDVYNYNKYFLYDYGKY